MLWDSDWFDGTLFVVVGTMGSNDCWYVCLDLLIGDAFVMDWHVVESDGWYGGSG